MPQHPPPSYSVRLATEDHRGAGDVVTREQQRDVDLARQPIDVRDRGARRHVAGARLSGIGCGEDDRDVGVAAAVKVDGGTISGAARDNRINSNSRHSRLR